jgi:hypothetical protein
MYRSVLLGIGVIETLVAGVLITVGCCLPRREVVDDSFQRVGHATESGEKQVQLMRLQVDEVRRTGFPQLTRQLRSQTDAVAANVQSSTVDFAALQAMSDGLGATAKGLETWSEVLNPKQYQPALDSLGTMADLLDGKGRPGENGLDGDWRQLTKLIHEPLDVLSSPELIAVMVRLAAKRQALEQLQQDGTWPAARAELRNLESSLEQLVEQTEALSAASYPALTNKGVEMKQAWPDGARTAAGLRGWLVAVKAVNRDLEGVDAALASALNSFECIEPADECDNRDCKVRSPQRLRESAASLRTAQLGLSTTLQSWPALVGTMKRSVQVLYESRRQLDGAISHRQQYERTLRDSKQLAHSVEELLESYTTKLDACLGEQQQSLEQMENGLHQVSAALPEAQHTTSDLFVSLRWMFWLVGGLIGLHGLFLAASVHLKH